MSQKAASRGKLESLQILRGLAATLVLVSHVMREVSPLAEGSTSGFAFQKGGQFGVDIFFIISGFIMTFVTYGNPKGVPSAGDFLVRRIFRVVPMYWLFTTITVIVSFVAAGSKNHSDTGFSYLASSYFFWPFLRPDGHATPALGVGWTLNYEMFFYVLFSISLLIRGRYAWLVATAALGLLVACGVVVPDSFSPVWYWTRPILLEFGAGLVLGYWHVQGIRLPAWVAGLFMAIGWVWWYIGSCALDPTDSYVRAQLWGVPAFLIVTGFMLFPRPIASALPDRMSWLCVKIGDCSFSTYLSHMFIVRVIMLTLNRLAPQFRHYEYICAICLVVVATSFAYLVYRYLEKPMTTYLDNRFPKRAATKTKADQAMPLGS